MPTRSDAALLRVRVQPRASRDAVTGWREGVLAVRVTAPPVEGAANAAVRALLAGALDVPPSAVSVLRGERGRDKLVQVAGLTRAEVVARLAKAVPAASREGGGTS
jgi:uncharacterized protein (TIGR00251 family)